MTNLTKYNQKRNFNKTKEPKGIKQKSKQKLHFVVQHHLAKKDHYDFRLELNGTLKSWAVPKGPSYNSKDKRLAVHVEDHPLAYRNFEGTIPKGEYGGGTVMLWDEGTWEPITSPKQGYQKGSLKFILHGQRLKGKWTLVRFKEDNWLLIKEKDDFYLYQDINEFNTSIRTQRTMAEIATNKPPQVKNSIPKNLVEGITITNPEKLMYPQSKITKMAVVKYYQAVAKRMLPYIEGRIISTIRCPKGIEEESFFKKHYEEESEGLGKINLPTTKNQRLDYYYIRNTTGIINEVQMNGLEFHIWGSSIANLNHPNLLVFDLDPDQGMPIAKIREGVKDLKSILDELHLKSYLKTSGGKGYHVVVPVHNLKTWKSFRTFAQDIAQVMETKWPDKYTSNIRKSERKGKIFIDWLRNTKSASSVAPYSLRARSNAPVSFPLKWSELDKVKPNEITLPKALKLLKRKDPWAGFFDIE